jgi:2,5-diketo-D-gluconate reductase B
VRVRVPYGRVHIVPDHVEQPEMDQPTVRIDDDLEIPRIGFGTFLLQGDDAYRSVRTALEAGYRHVDTAQGYANEAEVGRALADSSIDRSEVFLTTKLKPSNAAAADVHRSIEQSLRDLGVDRVDLLLLHWPAEHVAPLEETLDAMTKVRDAGLARAIGVSNFPSAMLRRAYEHAPLVTDQVEHHPFLGVHPIEQVLHEHGGFLTAYSPLAKGAVADDPTLREIGEAHGVSGAQVALRWMLQRPAVVAIPKSGTEERIRSNLDVFGFELSDEEMGRIDHLDRGHRIVDPDGAPEWD